MPRNDSTVPKKGKSKGTHNLPFHPEIEIELMDRKWVYSSNKEDCDEKREIFKL